MNNISNDRLDKMIDDLTYLRDALIAYRNVEKSGSCNNCWNKNCQWKPKWGEQVRFNCPHRKNWCDE